MSLKTTTPCDLAVPTVALTGGSRESDRAEAQVGHAVGAQDRLRDVVKLQPAVLAPFGGQHTAARITRRCLLTPSKSRFTTAAT